MANDASADAKAPVETDLDAIRERYRQERDKRLRADTDGQYIEARGDFARFNDHDPFVEPGFVRPPSDIETDVLVIGGGFGGLTAAAYLREEGVSDLRIIEAGGDFGGAWYWNRYPGAECDIESYIYLPLLEETGYLPKAKYSFASEIFEHCQRIGRHYDLYGVTDFQTRVDTVTWDAPTQRWIVRTHRGDTVRPRFVVMAAGSLPRPKLPGIPGLPDFKGPVFHTCRWDYGFTGGDPNAARWDYNAPGGGDTGKLEKLADKKVAMIGTGATGLQCMPYLARDAQHLYLFQRTPSAVGLRHGNPATEAAWAQALTPGWQKRRRVNFEEVMAGRPTPEDQVQDCWTKMFRNMRAAITPDMSPQEAAQRAEVYDLQMMQAVRAEIAGIVQDPEVAAALQPWFRPGCKRPAYNDEYLGAFNRPNVTLIDVSATQGVERITPNGIMVGDREIEVDGIILATGFELALQDLRRGIGLEVFGRGGVSLFDHWADGLSTLHGYATRGFPNLFYLGFSQNGRGFNQGEMLGEQSRHVAYVAAEALRRRVTMVEPTLEAESEWVAGIRKMARDNREFLRSCTPGYYNNEGAVREGGLAAEAYTSGMNAFNEMLAAWRADGQLEGLELSTDPKGG